jgi:hypothetical protein
MHLVCSSCFLLKNKSTPTYINGTFPILLILLIFWRKESEEKKPIFPTLPLLPIFQRVYSKITF